MAGKENTYCCSCQSDYEQCSRCASFIRLYRSLPGFNCRNQYWRSRHSDRIHGKPDKFQIYCKRKQESEREVFGNIHSLQYYIHDIHVNIVFFFLDKGFPGITKAIAILSSQKILRGTLPSWKKSRGEINIFSVPIQRSLIFTFFLLKKKRGL